jgi:hypothetical protein
MRLCQRLWDKEAEEVQGPVWMVMDRIRRLVLDCGGSINNEWWANVNVQNGMCPGMVIKISNR